MAIYHLHAKIIGRTHGKRALAAAAYRSGTKITEAIAYRSGSTVKDNASATTFDYTKKKGVVHSEILCPDYAPSWAADREILWNEVERKENRKDSQLAREVNAALPEELSLVQQADLATEFVRDNFVKEGMVADVNIHDTGKGNPHVHILLTTRVLTPEGFGEKARQWNTPSMLAKWRESWAEHANRHLSRAEIDARIDHRSFSDLEIDLEPTTKLGVCGRVSAERKNELERVKEYRRIVHSNGVKIVNNPKIALDYLTRHQDVFSQHDMHRALNTHTLDAEQFNLARAAVESSPELVLLGEGKDGKARYTTRSVIEANKRTGKTPPTKTLYANENPLISPYLQKSQGDKQLQGDIPPRELDEWSPPRPDGLSVEERILRIDKECYRLTKLARDKRRTLRHHISNSKKPIDDIASLQRNDPTFRAASDLEKIREKQRIVARHKWDEYKNKGGFLRKRQAALAVKGYDFGEAKRIYSEYQNAEAEYQSARNNRLHIFAFLNRPEMRREFRKQIKREVKLKNGAIHAVKEGLREIDGLERRAGLFAEASDKLKIDENRKAEQWNNEQIKKAKRLQARMQGVSRRLDGLNAKQSQLEQQIDSFKELTTEEAFKRIPEYSQAYEQVTKLSEQHMLAQKAWGLYEIEQPKQARAVRAGLMGRFFKEAYEIHGRMSATLQAKAEAKKRLNAVHAELLKPENKRRVESLIKAQSAQKAKLEKQLINCKNESKRLDLFYEELSKERNITEGQKARGGWLLNKSHSAHPARWSEYAQGHKRLPSRQERSISDLLRSIQRERSIGLPPGRHRR